MNAIIKSLITIVLIILGCVCLSCSSSNGRQNNATEESSASLAQYAGKWELFQVGNSPSESATFTLTIKSNGDASISHYARVGYSETCLESGDGYAQLDGNVLFVEITEGMSKGTTLRLIAQNDQIYSADAVSYTNLTLPTILRV